MSIGFLPSQPSLSAVLCAQTIYERASPTSGADAFHESHSTGLSHHPWGPLKPTGCCSCTECPWLLPVGGRAGSYWLLCMSFPNSEVTDIMLRAQNWPQGEDLHHGNWQALCIKIPCTPSLLLTFTHHCPLPAALCAPGFEAALRCLSSSPAPSAAELCQSLTFSAELGNTTTLPSFLSGSIPAKCPLPQIKQAHTHQQNKTVVQVHVYSFK